MYNTSYPTRYQVQETKPRRLLMYLVPGTSHDQYVPIEDRQYCTHAIQFMLPTGDSFYVSRYFVQQGRVYSVYHVFWYSNWSLAPGALEQILDLIRSILPGYCIIASCIVCTEFYR